jgi:hypothetical protein
MKENNAAHIVSHRHFEAPSYSEHEARTQAQRRPGARSAPGDVDSDQDRAPYTLHNARGQLCGE